MCTGSVTLTATPSSPLPKAPPNFWFSVSVSLSFHEWYRVILSYIVSLRPTWDIWDPSLNSKQTVQVDSCGCGCLDCGQCVCNHRAIPLHACVLPGGRGSCCFELVRIWPYRAASESYGGFMFRVQFWEPCLLSRLVASIHVPTSGVWRFFSPWLSQYLVCAVCVSAIWCAQCAAQRWWPVWLCCVFQWLTSLLLASVWGSACACAPC